MTKASTTSTTEAHKNSTVRNGILLGISLLLFALAGWIALNRQYVLDEIRLARYTPTPEIVALKEATTMRGEGERMFYASHPEINDRAAFNQNCSDHGERTIVLGCYKGLDIYIFDVTDERLPGVKEVTAAHEMLHAAYDRLDGTERQRVDELVRAEVAKITDPRLSELVKLYRTTEPDNLLNEMHSIVGTEVAEISPELEAHYARYFADRSKVVALSEGYERVFTDLKAEQDRLSAELDSINQQVRQRSEALNRGIEQLNSDIADFNRRANGGEFESQAEFQTERQALAARQAALSAERAAINALIDRFNEIRRRLAELNLQAQSLNQSLDSTPQEVPNL